MEEGLLNNVVTLNNATRRNRRKRRRTLIHEGRTHVRPIKGGEPGNRRESSGEMAAAETEG
jgi:hypothetical protein